MYLSYETRVSRPLIINLKTLNVTVFYNDYWIKMAPSSDFIQNDLYESNAQTSE